MESLQARILAAVRAIPCGRVATYGDVARMAGAPRAARQVGWALAGLPEDTDVPWWRVVNRQGAVSCRSHGAEEQAAHLRAEGIPVDPDGRLDLPRFSMLGSAAASPHADGSTP